MYTALEIAKYVVSKCASDGCPITHSQLQKILYFIQAYFLINIGSPAFYEDIQAWKCGSVIQKVYDEYSCYGYSQILEINSMCSLFDTEEEKSIADHVIEKLKRVSNSKLDDILHETGSPWDMVYHHKMNGEYTNVISCQLIKDYYEKK